MDDGGEWVDNPTHTPNHNLGSQGMYLGEKM